MPRTLKYVLIGLGVVVALAILAAVILAATFDPNKYKPLIIELVKEKKQRTLAIPGEIKLTFFPKLGANLGKLSLSERNGSATFASIDSARVSVALLPLLRKELVVDHVGIDGVRANVKRYKDGKTNFDDLAGAEETRPAAPPQQQQSAVKLNVDGVSIANAAIVYEDQKAGSRYELANASIETGKIGEGKSGKLSFKAHVRSNKPAVDADVSLKSDYLLEMEKQHYVLKAISLEIAGKVEDMSELKVGIAGNLDAQMKPLKLDLSELAIAFRAKQPKGELEAKLGIPGLKMDEKELQVPRLTADLSLPGPAGGSMRVSAAGSAAVRLDRETAQANLAGKFDESNFTAKLSVEKFSPLAFGFDAGIDRLDVDRYLGKGEGAAKDGSSKGGGAPAKAGKASGPEEPIDLSALKDLNAHGSAKIGALKVANINASNVRVDLRAAGGKVDVNPIAANLYKGTVAGSASIAAGSPNRFALKQTLAGISIGPLLKDAIGEERIEGTGSVALDVTTQGAVVSALKKGLAGTARVDLKDGAVRGVNLAQILRGARAKLGGGGGSDAGAGSSQEKTDFSEMTASFRIANGVAHNDDLSAKSPLFRLGGSGDINVGQDRLDYTVKATVVGSLQGQGGPELEALKGVTVPVTLSGPFDKIGYRVDFGSMVSDKAKQKVEEKKDELRNRAQERLKDLFRR